MALKESTRIILQKYSVFSVSFVFLNNSIESEVVYVDIEPDVVLENEMDSYVIDLNNDFINDFSFLNRSYDFGGYWTSGSIYYIPFNHNERIIGSALYENSFAANTQDFGTTFSSLIRELPFALEAGIIINESFTFLSNYHQLLVIKTAFDLSGEVYNYGGHWFPEAIDHYLGVKFQDDNSNYHYGWIRCDVLDEGRRLVIKDYAYEVYPDYPIVAGDTAHLVGISEFQNTIDATIYSFNSTIYINLNEPINEVNVHIYDLEGKQVYDGKLVNQYSQIELENAKGMYIVELVSEDKNIKTTRVALQ